MKFLNEMPRGILGCHIFIERGERMYKGYTIPIHWELTLDELMAKARRECEKERAKQNKDSGDEVPIKAKDPDREDPR